MRKVMSMVGTTVGSAAGWWVGAHAGIMTAFMLSIVGFGAGMWYGRKLADRMG